jgi:triacylglycerol lipase
MKKNSPRYSANRDRTPVRAILIACLLTFPILMISCSTARFKTGPDHHVATKSTRVSKGKVVLVHGIFDTRIGLRPLRRAIVAGGYECLVPSLKPVDGRKGLEPMARQLRHLVDTEWGENAEFSIVAFSMGGLVSRYYLQELDGAKRCQGLYTIATPHNGTYMAYLYPGRGTRQMRPESTFLANLQRGKHIYDTFDIPTTSYRSPLDMVMLPLRSPKWQQGDNVRFWSPIHPALLWEKKLHADLLKRLDATRRP